jgi:hypothetical protein
VHERASGKFAPQSHPLVVRELEHESSGKFTLARYVHLLSNDLGAPLDLREKLDGGNLVATEATGNGRNRPPVIASQLAE